MIVCTLKKVLKGKGWTRYKLQQKSGITYPTLHALFHGRSKGYTADVLNRLCSTLHCKTGDLLEWRPDHPRFPRLKKKLK
jgi:DNA-binding Xre family transcriptional regulator